LTRLFASLVAQHYDEIEWIVVDDGGTDDTGDTIAQFRRDARFRVQFLRQSNSGKNVAVNAGLEIATGELVCIVDDDDLFLPDMFATVAKDYATIAGNGKVAGLSYLTIDQTGKVWGRRFPRDRMISDHFECRINQRIWGDKFEFTKSRVLRENSVRYPVTEMKGGFGADTVFFFRIAETYETCYVNRPVLEKVYRSDGISVNWRQGSLKNPQLTAKYYAAFLNSRVRLSIRFKYMIAYLAILWYSRQKLAIPQIQAPWNRLLFYLSYLPGIAVGFRWRGYRGKTPPQSRKWLRSKAG
jgi:glycosyltransferase involved in cell wall biosynthesis